MATAGEIRASLPDSDPLAAALVRAYVGDVPDDAIVDDDEMLAHLQDINDTMETRTRVAEAKHAKAKRQRTRRAHLSDLIVRVARRQAAQKRQLPGGPIIFEALSVDEQNAIRAWIRMNESSQLAKTDAA